MLEVGSIDSKSIGITSLLRRQAAVSDLGAAAPSFPKDAKAIFIANVVPIRSFI